MIRYFHPDPDLDFLPISDPGVKKAQDPESGSATLVKRRVEVLYTPNQTVTK
jgi:hypothetical protein